MTLTRLCLIAALLATTSTVAAKRPRAEPGQFDYYAVALSWSPSYCATKRDPDQCDSGRRLGFVLHGLWPQFEAGYPEYCTRQELPPDTARRYAPLFPSARLAGHEWRKHGTCTGLDPAAYFTLSDQLRNRLVIPPALRQPDAPLRISHRQFVQAFRAVNPALAPDSVLPYCAAGGRFLRELHACYDKAGRSRSCSAGAIKRSYSSCRAETFLIQNVR